MVTIINNNRDSRYFLLKFAGTSITAADKETIIPWFLSCLSTIDDPAIYTNFNSDYSFEVIPNYCECEEYSNTLTVAIYMRWRKKQERDETDMIVLNDDMPEVHLPISKLNDCLIDPPACVLNIGISGISRELLKRKWWSLLDGQNGYLWYNSYHRLQNGDWEIQIDRSNEYKWDDVSYPINGN
jgi:hypothetical protein